MKKYFFTFLFLLFPVSSFAIIITPNTTQIAIIPPAPAPYFSPDTVTWTCTSPLSDIDPAKIYFFESDIQGAGSQNCDLSFDENLVLSDWLEATDYTPFPAGVYHVVEASDIGTDYGICNEYISCIESPYFIDETTITITDIQTPTVTGSLFHFTNPITNEPSTNPVDLVASVGTVSTNTFDSAFPYMLVFIGVPLSFFIMQKLRDLIMFEGAKRREKLEKQNKRDL
jgi:hypothetical protein